VVVVVGQVVRERWMRDSLSLFTPGHWLLLVSLGQLIPFGQEDKELGV
jgi:hypothetical protein